MCYNKYDSPWDGIIWEICCGCRTVPFKSAVIYLHNISFTHRSIDPCLFLETEFAPDILLCCLKVCLFILTGVLIFWTTHGFDGSSSATLCCTLHLFSLNHQVLMF